MIDAQLIELVGDQNLIFWRKADPLALRAVPECSVECNNAHNFRLVPEMASNLQAILYQLDFPHVSYARNLRMLIWNQRFGLFLASERTMYQP